MMLEGTAPGNAQEAAVNEAVAAGAEPAVSAERNLPKSAI